MPNFRNRPVDAASAPAQKSLFHGRVQIPSGSGVALTGELCSSIAIVPDPANLGAIYIGFETDMGNDPLTPENGFPLSTGIVLAANQKSRKVRVYAVSPSEGNYVRIIGVW